MVGVLEVIADNELAVFILVMAIIATIVFGLFLAHRAVDHVLNGGRLPFNLIFWVGTALSVLWASFILWSYLP